MESLKARKVYKLVPRTAVPPGRKRIKSKWVFKRKADGSFKGRLVIHYIPTDNNPADIGTKHLNKHRFKHLMDLISKFDVNDFISSKFK